MTRFYSTKSKEHLLKQLMVTNDLMKMYLLNYVYENYKWNMSHCNTLNESWYFNQTSIGPSTTKTQPHLVYPQRWAVGPCSWITDYDIVGINWIIATPRRQHNLKKRSILPLESIETWKKICLCRLLYLDNMHTQLWQNTDSVYTRVRNLNILSANR